MAKKKILTYLPFKTYTVRTKEGANKKKYTPLTYSIHSKKGGK